jgi:hypothetical protein
MMVAPSTMLVEACIYGVGSDFTVYADTVDTVGATNFDTVEFEGHYFTNSAAMFHINS